MLLGEENGLVQTRELEYCIRESMDNLNLVGVFTSFASSCRGALPVRTIIAAYDFYETLVERLLDDMTAMMVHLTCTDDQIRMKLQLGFREEIAPQVLSGIELPLGSFRCEIMEEDAVIDLTITEGGAGK